MTVPLVGERRPRPAHLLAQHIPDPQRAHSGAICRQMDQKSQTGLSFVNTGVNPGSTGPAVAWALITAYLKLTSVCFVGFAYFLH